MQRARSLVVVGIAGAPQGLAFQNAEPDFDLAQPRGVHWQELEPYPTGLGGGQPGVHGRGRVNRPPSRPQAPAYDAPHLAAKLRIRAVQPPLDAVPLELGVAQPSVDRALADRWADVAPRGRRLRQGADGPVRASCGQFAQRMARRPRTSCGSSRGKLWRATGPGRIVPPAQAVARKPCEPVADPLAVAPRGPCDRGEGCALGGQEHGRSPRGDPQAGAPGPQQPLQGGLLLSSQSESSLPRT